MRIGLGYIPEAHQVNDVIEARISFKPLIAFMNDSLAIENTTKTRFIQLALNEFYKFPELSGFIKIEDVHHYLEIFELIYGILSPLTIDENKHLWAIAAPISKNVFFGTDAYIKLVDSQNSVELNAGQVNNERERIKRRLKRMAYKMILSKYYDFSAINIEKVIYPYFDIASQLERYYQVKPDTRFIEINNKHELPSLNFDYAELYVQDGEVTSTLEKILPLENFYFEGFTVITLEDITEDYAIETIKKALITHSHNDVLLYKEVRYGLKLLGGCQSTEFGMLPFMSVNGNLVLDDVPCSQSVIIKIARKSEKDMAAVHAFVKKYIQNPAVKVFSDIEDDDNITNAIMYSLMETGIKSYAVVPVYYSQNLVGILEVCSRNEEVDYDQTLNRINDAIPLIAQLLQNSVHEFEAKIIDIIRDKFTAIQPAVQWKFKEVALDYYRESRAGETCSAIGTVSFLDVYPLYGMIDIRNSTIERNNALAKDINNLLSLLNTAQNSICNLLDGECATLVNNEFANWYIAISLFLNSGDSGLLDLFLKTEIVPYLRKLSNNNPEAIVPAFWLKEILERDGPEISRNRNHLEAAMQKINDALNKLFSREHQRLMNIYPCYFETFRTDGVEYDLYAGQSISPEVTFLPQHLESFRIWQLRSMVKAARLTRKVLKEKDWNLLTTQLIYVNPHAINICFRNDERHFDVEGSYNIRYHVVKKRIDKVRLKDTGERLTQPGKIAIVYYNDSDFRTYLHYINILQKAHFLDEQIDNVELEDVQGIYGLKALRVGVKY